MSDRARADALARSALEAALTDPEGAKALLEAAAQLAPQQRKRTRAAMLERAFGQAAALAKALDWNGTVVVRGGELLVEQDGALFHDDGGWFFRSGGASIAKPMRRMLKARGIIPQTVFDIGANIGEVAISFASVYPDARVFAFEPAPENLRRLRANVALQPRRLANLTVVPEAVSDRAGEIEMTVGADRLNTLMLDEARERLGGRPEVEIARVPTDTLDGYCARFGVERIDFLKIDIEGAEPLLAAAVRRLGGRIGSALAEVSRYGELGGYLELADAFLAGGLRMLDEELEPVREPETFLARRLEQAAAINVWFLP